MSDLIERDALMNEFVGCGFLHESVICHAIRKAPGISDADNVIHCKDCAYYTASPFGHRIIGWCKIDGKHRGQNFYCANGDRRDTEV